MSVGKSSIKRVAAPAAETKKPVEEAKAVVAEKTAPKKAAAKTAASKATAKSTSKVSKPSSSKASKPTPQKAAPKAKSGIVSVTDDMPYYLL